MRYAPCRYCEEATAVDRGDPVCGSCELIMGNSNQQSEQDLMREEDQDWQADTDQAETDLLEEEVRRQMAEDDQRLYRDRLRGNSNEALFRSVYLDGNQSNDENEEELYENDQDDFNFDMSYQDNIQAIRDQLSSRQFDLALDRAAIVQRLLRIFVNNEEGLQDDASQAKGATEADISTLKTRTLSSETDDQGTECAICTEKFESLELTQLPCNHEYHSECIHHWLKLNASCPMCRQSIFKSVDDQPQQQGEEPGLIIIRRETADRLRQSNSPMSFMDDVD